jgi:hypothetical protein
MNRPDGWIPVKRPSLGSLFLAAIPFVAVCFSVAVWDRLHPIILGLPFNYFWLIAWLLLTPMCLWGAYRVENRKPSDSTRKLPTL